MAFCSVSIPHTFLSSISMSLGHFIRAGMLVVFLIALATAVDAMSDSLGVSLGFNLGLSIMERYIPPSGESHVLVSRPLPCVCWFARMVVPSSASVSASSRALLLVESISL